jgi:aspartate/methionine/tyrosine aminotransferase
MYNLANSMGGDLVRFETGGVDFPTPDHIVKSANAAMLEGKTPYKGNDGLRSAIAAKLERKNGIHKSTEEIMVTTGGSEALFLVFQAMINKGDEVIVANPSWPHFAEMIKLSGGLPVEVPFISKDGQKFDAAPLERAITSRTRAILINSPHNPTGNVLSEDELKQIADLAGQKGIPVISDEVYEDLVYDSNRHVSIGSLYDNVISLYSFSKTYAMCGWRLGYLAADVKLIDTMTKLHIYSVTCVPSFIQMAGQTALEGDQSGVSDMVKAYKQRRNCLINGFNSIPNIKCPIPKGALYAWPDVSYYGKSNDIAKRLVEKARCVTVPGSAFGSSGEGRLRLSLSLSEDRINEGIRRMKEAFSRMDGKANKT